MRTPRARQQLGQDAFESVVAAILERDRNNGILLRRGKGTQMSDEVDKVDLLEHCRPLDEWKKKVIEDLRELLEAVVSVKVRTFDFGLAPA